MVVIRMIRLTEIDYQRPRHFIGFFETPRMKRKNDLKKEKKKTDVRSDKNIPPKKIFQVFEYSTTIKKKNRLQ